jgi:hypothetical protein
MRSNRVMLSALVQSAMGPLAPNALSVAENNSRPSNEIVNRPRRGLEPERVLNIRR